MSKLLHCIGLMSGTSLDGIDVAAIRTDGEDQVERGPARTLTYDEGQRSLLRRALNDALPMTQRDQRPGCLGQAEEALTRWHADAVQSFCKESDLSLSNIDLISFHGQTVLHRPERHLTVQIGDGPLLSRLLARPVAYDLRAADVAAGGQGAPLVPAYHRALAAKLKERPAAFVNIGGVANVTWIGHDGSLVAFDTGPGNALIDDWMVRHTGKVRDENGALARQGRVSDAALAQFTGDSYFEERPPKSLDRNSFASLSLDDFSPADGAATLTAFTAEAIALAKRWFPEDPQVWIICGGGRRNETLMQEITKRLPRVLKSEEAGFDGDSMEAEAWAYLGVRSLLGLPLTFPGTTGVAAPLTGGVLAKP